MNLKYPDREKPEMMLRVFCIFSAILLFAAAFLFGSPKEIAWGMGKIVLSRDALITDYFELAGYGAAFFNAGLMMLLSVMLLEKVKMSYTGLTLAAVFINTGFGFWGKNPINSIPIILGTWIYARVHNASFAKYVYTALFATCLSPFVTELVYILPFDIRINLLAAIVTGIFVGFTIPPLSMHTVSMHKGYNLFNVGFSGGILAFVISCVLKSYGMESESVFIWKAERHPAIIVGVLLYFLGVFFLGVWMEQGSLNGICKILRHPGRAAADFVVIGGIGSTLMNMGIMGLVTEGYVLLSGGDMSGPILGCMLAVFGFAAFGAHVRNYLPVLAGVLISTFFSKYSYDSPGIQIASLFVVGVSPIAGQFGVSVGIVAGILHTAIVMCTSQMYSGLNLYNNGFSAGWVAIVMLPVLESFEKQPEVGKQKKKVQ